MYLVGLMASNLACNIPISTDRDVQVIDVLRVNNNNIHLKLSILKYSNINLISMQKLYDRIGTEQHKYRLALQFTSIFIGNHGYVPPGTCYRIILQRGSKKYSSNYLNIKPNC
jgi:hypothetical protein